MTRTLAGIGALTLLLVLAAAGPALDAVNIAIAPQTFQLGRDQGGAITVHAEIAFADVNTATVCLAGIPARSCKPDNRGELVAYFDEATVKALVAPPSATLTLTGQTNDGTPFAGVDTVVVTIWRGK